MALMTEHLQQHDQDYDFRDDKTQQVGIGEG